MPRLITALALALAAASPAAPARLWLAAEHLTAAIAREPADTLPPLPQTAVARATLADRAAATLAAMRYWQPRAEAGDADAQYRLGQNHSRQGDHQTAQDWYRKAAAQGDPRAYIALALHRLAPLQKINNGAYNSTLAEEYDAASAWLELAIDTNRSAVAEYWRGCINHKRDPDADTAGAYWYAAAAQNYLPAMLNLQRYDDPYWLTRAIRTDPEHLLLRRELRQLADPGQNTALSTGSACYRFDTDNLLAYVLTEADQWPEKPPQQQCRADIPADDSDDTPAITATDTWQNTYTAAIRGDAAAQYRLGQTYARGDGVRPDPDEARKWLAKATAQQLPDAQTALAILAWQSGDTESARENLNRAAANHPDARYWLGQLAHAQGDETAATAHWQRAAAQNHAGAMRELGNQQARQGDQQNARDWWYRAAETAAHTVAARYWQHRAAAGDAEAQYQLGQHYALGAGVPLDPDAARAWYSKAARQEHARAQTALSLLAQHGQQKPYTVSDGARYWWEKAAAQGETNAQNWLGQIAAKAKNDRLAQDWYRRAAAGGNNIAMRHLADSYHDRYSDADHSDALGQYWQTQATQGHHPDPETLYWLGARDRNSGSYAAPATPKENRARALIRQASDLGSGHASDDLARESRHGYHRQPQNETLADYYELKAKNQGFPFIPGELNPARPLVDVPHDNPSDKEIQMRWLRLKQRSGLPALQQNLRALWHY